MRDGEFFFSRTNSTKLSLAIEIRAWSLDSFYFRLVVKPKRILVLTVSEIPLLPCGFLPQNLTFSDHSHQNMQAYKRTTSIEIHVHMFTLDVFLRTCAHTYVRTYIHACRSLDFPENCLESVLLDVFTEKNKSIQAYRIICTYVYTHVFLCTCTCIRTYLHTCRSLDVPENCGVHITRHVYRGKKIKNVYFPDGGNAGCPSFSS